MSTGNFGVVMDMDKFTNLINIPAGSYIVFKVEEEEIEPRLLGKALVDIDTKEIIKEYMGIYGEILNGWYDPAMNEFHFYKWLIEDKKLIEELPFYHFSPCGYGCVRVGGTFVEKTEVKDWEESADWYEKKMEKEE